MDELNKQSWSPSTEAARLQRTAYLGGTCFTERKRGSSTEGPYEYSAEDRSVMCVRKLPSGPSERISGIAPATPHLETVLLPPSQSGCWEESSSKSCFHAEL